MTAGGRAADAYFQHDCAAFPCPGSRRLSALLAVTAAGCGGSAVAVPELTSFTTAAQKSSTANSARFVLELEDVDALRGRAARRQRRGRLRHCREAVGAHLRPLVARRALQEPRLELRRQGHGRSRQSRRLEARRDPGRRRRLHPLPADRRRSFPPARPGSRAMRRISRARTPASWASSARSPASTLGTSSGC